MNKDDNYYMMMMMFTTSRKQPSIIQLKDHSKLCLYTEELDLEHSTELQQILIKFIIDHSTMTQHVKIYSGLFLNITLQRIN